MKRFLMVLSLILLAFTPSQVFAEDSDNRSYTFTNGKSVFYNHYIGYSPVNCGPDHIVYYAVDHHDRSAAVSDGIGLSYNAYNVTEVLQYSDSIYQNSGRAIYEQTPTGTLSESEAEFEFDDSSGSWNPSSLISPCLSWSADSEADNSTEETSLEKVANFYGQSSSSQTISQSMNVDEEDQIINIIDENYSERLEEFGVSGSDFEIVETYQEETDNLTDDFSNINFENAEITNYDVINLQVNNPVGKEGDSYSLKFYFVLDQDKNQSLDYGLITEKE